MNWRDGESSSKILQHFHAFLPKQGHNKRTCRPISTLDKDMTRQFYLVVWKAAKGPFGVIESSSHLKFYMDAKY